MTYTWFFLPPPNILKLLRIPSFLTGVLHAARGPKKLYFHFKPWEEKISENIFISLLFPYLFLVPPYKFYEISTILRGSKEFLSSPGRGGTKASWTRWDLLQHGKLLSRSSEFLESSENKSHWWGKTKTCICKKNVNSPVKLETQQISKQAMMFENNLFMIFLNMKTYFL